MHTDSTTFRGTIMNILCIGDSLTYGYGVGRSETWCALASQLTGHEFINKGVNGATTGEMAEQQLYGDEVLVMGGLNNFFMGMPVSVPLADIRSICERAVNLGIRPVVGIPMQISPNVSEAWCEGPIDMDIVRSAYAEFACALLQQCLNDGTEYIDFRPVIGPEYLSFDGIHLNRCGHEHMANAVAAHWNARRK
ncbi:GDSL-type esterase/lipase family protein [uncultured Mailhella sp.]|uniref:GDSL-type esterase/lipase family protein n=1 Tax=uncultured Mailhella sp. TaxID=1981031 RepID=UPI003209F015